MKVGKKVFYNDQLPATGKIDFRGFTLVELLLGLGLFLLVSLSLNAVFASGIFVNQQSEKTAKIYQEAGWILDGLAADLENMVVFSEYPAFAEAVFQGETDNLSFFLPTEKGLKAVRYSFQPAEQDRIHTIRVGQHSQKNRNVVLESSLSEDAYSLVREEASLTPVPEKEPSADGGREVISSQITKGDLRFSYASRDPAQGTLVWEDRWARKGLPLGIRVELILPDPAQKNETLRVRRDILVPVGCWGAG